MSFSRCLHRAPFNALVHNQPSVLSCRHAVHRSALRHTLHSSRTCIKRSCAARASSQPESAVGAISLGLKAYEKADYNEAIGLFKEALTLPGSGIKQYRWFRCFARRHVPDGGLFVLGMCYYRSYTLCCRDKPAIASDGEKISAYYNIACCLSRTGNSHDGLLALLEALQLGYEDFQQIRSDPDLAGLRADSQFEAVMGRFQKTNMKNLLS